MSAVWFANRRDSWGTNPTWNSPLFSFSFLNSPERSFRKFIYFTLAAKPSDLNRSLSRCFSFLFLGCFATQTGSTVVWSRNKFQETCGSSKRFFCVFIFFVARTFSTASSRVDRAEEKEKELDLSRATSKDNKRCKWLRAVVLNSYRSRVYGQRAAEDSWCQLTKLKSCSNDKPSPKITSLYRSSRCAAGRSERGDEHEK